MKYLLTSFFLITTLGTIAAQSFTRQDTLRGSITPERAWWDLTYYDLRISVDPEARSISGSNTIRYRVLEPANRMQIDLQEPLEIQSVLQEGRELPYEREGNAYFIQLEKTQAPGSVMEVAVYYSGKPREAVRAPWDGGFSWKTDSRGLPFIATSCQGLGASVWWPNKDHVSDKPDSMSIRVTVPQPLVVASNGWELPRDAQPGDVLHDPQPHLDPHVRQVVAPFQPPGDFIAIHLLAHEGELKAIGLAEHFLGKVVQSDPHKAAALDARPGVTVVEMVVAGNVEALDRVDPGGIAFGLGAQHVFEVLVEIAFFAAEVVGTGAVADASGQGVAADAIRLKSGDTAITPDAGKTSASRQTFVTGNAARLAGSARGVYSITRDGGRSIATVATIPGGSSSYHGTDAARRDRPGQRHHLLRWRVRLLQRRHSIRGAG